MRELALSEYEKKLEKFQNFVFDMPKRPRNGFIIYYQSKMLN